MHNINHKRMAMKYPIHLRDMTIFAARPLQASQAANISLCGAILRADRVNVGPARRSHSLLLLVVLIEQSKFDQSERSKKIS